MKCYLVDGIGIENIRLIEKKSPSIQNEGDVLVEVRACSLNYRDLMIAKGEYSFSKHPSIIPLSDMAGVVLEVGGRVSDFKPGDRVLNAPFLHWPAGVLRKSWAASFIGGTGVDGVLAEKIVFPADALVKVPSHLSFYEASTFTIAGLTAWSSIVTHGKTLPGNWVLLHGTGGVSMFSLQLADQIGARTIITTSKKEKEEYIIKNFKNAHVLNYKDSDWPQKVKELTGGSGVDVVVDVVGGKTLSLSLGACNFSARVAAVGVLGGKESVIQTRDLLRHQVKVQGIFMESTEQLRALMQAVESMQMRPVLDKIFPFSEAKDAYEYLEAGKHIGKVVIALDL